ncbi:MAG: AraC family transcriptional regulator [Clostridia bacterium]|nr:AraC family transcriptional regulator [Clostridia bacterium]
MQYTKYGVPSVITITKLVTIHYFELSKSFIYPPESHDFWEFHYVDKGSAVSVCEGEEIVLNQGDILFHKPNANHQLKSNGDSAPNVCVLSFVATPKNIPFLEKNKLHLTSEQRYIVKKILTEANAVFDLSKSNPYAHSLTERNNPPHGAMQMIKLYLEQLFILLCRDFTLPELHVSRFKETDYKDDLINSIVKFMQENITEKLTIEDICAKFNYGKTYLCTKFHEVTGKSINKYFIELKIETAKKIIREQTVSRDLFSKISDLLSFSDPSYFYYVFKKHTNMTPSEYSKSVRQ